MSGNVRSGWPADLGTACFIIFSVFGCLVSTSGLIEPIRKDLGLSFGEGGFLLSIPFPLIAFFAVTGGGLIDRLGVRRMVTIGVLITLAGGVLRAWSGGYWPLAAGIALVGVGTGLVFPALPKIVSATVPPERQELGSTLYTASVVTGAGSGVAASRVLGEWANAPFSGAQVWRGGYLAWALVLFAAFLLWRGLSGAGADVSAGETEKKGGASAAVFSNPAVWAVAASLFINNVIFYTSLGWLPSILMGKGFSPASAGVLVSLVPWLGVFAVLTAHKAAGAMGGERAMIAFCAVFMALALGVMPPSGSWLSALATASLGLTSNFWFLFCLAYPARYIEKDHAGQAGGLIIGLGYLGGFIGPWVVGAIRDWAGAFGPGLYALAVLSILGLLTVPFFGTRSETR